METGDRPVDNAHGTAGCASVRGVIPTDSSGATGAHPAALLAGAAVLTGLARDIEEQQQRLHYLTDALALASGSDDAHQAWCAAGEELRRTTTHLGAGLQDLGRQLRAQSAWFSLADAS